MKTHPLQYTRIERNAFVYKVENEASTRPLPPLTRMGGVNS